MSKPDLTWRSQTYVVLPPTLVWYDAASAGESGSWGFEPDPAYAQGQTGDSGAATGVFIPPFLSLAAMFDWTGSSKVIGSSVKTSLLPFDELSGNPSFDFVTWAKANNLAIAYQRKYNEATAFTVICPVQKKPAGGWHAISKPIVTQDDDDRYFGIAMSIMASYVGAGAIYGIANSYTSGNNAGVVTGALKAASGVDIPATTGVTTVDDLSLPDTSSYGNAFDSFNYSSGEATVAYSDSQNVDFGFNSGDVAPTDTLNTVGLAGNDPSSPSTDSSTLNFNDTPEVTTNEFGTTFADNGTQSAGSDANVAQSAVKGIPLGGAPELGAAVLQRVGAGRTSGGGLTSPKQNSGENTQSSQADAVSTHGNTFADFGRAAASVMSMSKEVYTAQGKTFTGQLGPGGAAQSGIIAGVSTQTILMIGIAAVAVGLFLHAGGK